MKSFTLFIALLLCTAIRAQTRVQVISQEDFDALEAKYEILVKEKDSPQKEEFVKQLFALREDLQNKLKTKIKTQPSFTEFELRQLSQMEVHIGELDRWLMFLLKEKIRQLPEFKALWAKLKPLHQQNSPDLHKVQSDLFHEACKGLEKLTGDERKKRAWEISAIFNLLNIQPEEPEQ